MAEERSRGVVRDGFTVVGRRPRGAAPGNIVSNEAAAREDDRRDIFDEIFADDPRMRRQRRLDRTTRDVPDDEPYIDYEG